MPRGIPNKKPAAEPLTLTPSALAEKLKDYPELKIWERHMLDPHDPGSLPILLKDDPNPNCGDLGHALKAKPFAVKCGECRKPFRMWYVRWGNLAEQERWSTLKNRGYIRVHVKDLADADDIAGLSDAKPDDVVTRGDRKGEALVRKPFAYYVESQREKERQHRARRNPRRVKQELADEAGRQLGDEAGQSTHDHLHIEQDIRHKTTLAEELGGVD
jgi:hypothetical protein